MKNHIVGSLTTYLANLTTKLTHYVKTENIKAIEQVTHVDESYEFMNPAQVRYKKPEKWNYLQYFDHLLKLDSSYAIQLEKKTEPFSLKEDLHILVTVSSNPNKIIVKSIEQLANNKNLYRRNFRNQLIKRTFSQLKQRHKLLSSIVKEPQLKYLTSWLQIHGLETKVFLQKSGQQQLQKTGSRIIVSKLPYLHQTTEKSMQLSKGKRKSKVKDYESDNQENQNDYENLIEKRSGQKRVHRESERSYDINKAFNTPPVKLQSDIQLPQAPKKTKKQDSSSQNIMQTPKKQRKIVRIIDAKKDVIIKQDSQEHKIHQSPANESPIVSEFKLYSTQQQKLKSDNRQQSLQQSLKEEQSQEQQSMMLEKILKEFETNSKMSKVRILKILDEVSGDSTDLKSFLETDDKNLLWKRLEDAVLRKYVKNQDKQQNNPISRALKVEVMYNEIIKTKGQERIKRRIRYLGLE